jgi:uncharacterized C2H2 Zn-finger protein
LGWSSYNTFQARLLGLAEKAAAEEAAAAVEVEAVELVEPVEAVELVEPVEAEEGGEEGLAGVPGEGSDILEGPKAAVEERPKISCDECHEAFSTASTLYEHKRSFHSEPANCLQCGKAFKSLKAMARHAGDVHGEARGVCATCGKTFRKKSGLDRHMADVHGARVRQDPPAAGVQRRRPAQPRLHACDQCDFSSTNRTLFRKHRLTEHPEDKAFACEQCDKAFVLRCTLAQHVSRSHRDVFFPCMGDVEDGVVVRPGCGKVFDRHDSLLRHKKTCGQPKAPRPYGDLSRWQQARRADGEAARILSELDRMDPEQRKRVLVRMVKRDPSILDLYDRNPITMDTVIEVIIVIIQSFHTYFTFFCRSSVTCTCPTDSALRS